MKKVTNVIPLFPPCDPFLLEVGDEEELCSILTAFDPFLRHLEGGDWKDVLRNQAMLTDMS
jgi:hypothetical protein